MKALMKQDRSSGAVLEQVDIPKPKSNEVLIKVESAAICGTDLHIYNWDQWADSRINPPLIFGHEFSGEVVELGADVKDIETGTRVTAEGHFVCGKCFFCKTGQAHICENVEIIGVDTTGCFAEYVVVPRDNVWILDKSIPPEIGAIHDPIGNAIHSALIDEITAKDVLVTGCGPIGLASIAIARKAGASKIFATEVNSYRIELAKKMGADEIINPMEQDTVELVKSKTNGAGVDVLLEMAGKDTAINEGLAALKGGGWVSFLGLPPGKTQIDLSNGLIFKGAKAYGINGRIMYETWFKMHNLLKSRLADDLMPMVTHKFSFEQFEEAFQLAQEGNTGKIILHP